MISPLTTRREEIPDVWNILYHLRGLRSSRRGWVSAKITAENSARLFRPHVTSICPTNNTKPKSNKPSNLSRQNWRIFAKLQQHSALTTTQHSHKYLNKVNKTMKEKKKTAVREKYQLIS